MKIAVIGTGISGMGAAWLLNRQHEVTVYERNDYIGGHSNTVEVKFPDRTIPVDTGFIVYNERNYPNLIALFKALKVETEKTEMSFSVSLNEGSFEYAGTNLNTVFGQRSNVMRPAFLKMLKDVVRFNDRANLILDTRREISLGEYLDELGMGEWFRKRYLLPMAGAIWSCPMETMLEYPAQSFIRFFENHGLLTVNDQPQWYTVTGGSREYVKRITKPYESRIKLNTPVVAVTRQDGGVLIEDAKGGKAQYDHVVMAVHGDQLLPLLKDAGEEERNVMKAFRTQPNRAVLHMDASLMPKRERVWSSWNYMANDQADGTQELSVTYWMNKLQHIPEGYPIFLSLNPIKEPREGSIFYECQYNHPVFDKPARNAQKLLNTLQGFRNTWFCGAWQRYGFHEDGLLSALQVANSLGVRAPWQN